MKKTLAVALLAAMVATHATATIVSATFSGTITQATTGVSLGEGYTGSFQYDSDAPLLFSGPDYAVYTLANNSVSFTIGGVTYTNGNVPYRSCFHNAL